MNLIISLVLNAFALIATAYLVPGFHVTGFKTALLAAIVLGIINTFIKPVLSFLTAPLTFVTFGLFAFVVNAVVLWLASLIVRGVVIESALSAIVAAAVLSIISTILAMLLKDVEVASLKKKR